MGKSGLDIGYLVIIDLDGEERIGKVCSLSEYYGEDYSCKVGVKFVDNKIPSSYITYWYNCGKLGPLARTLYE